MATNTDNTHIRFWMIATVSANVPTMQKNFGVTSITDTATGQMTVNLTRAFDSANWCCQVTAERATTTATAAEMRVAGIKNAGLTSTTVVAECWDTQATPALKDPASWHVAGFGEQPIT